MKHIILSLLLAALGCLTASADFLNVLGESVDIGASTTVTGISSVFLSRGTISYYPPTKVLEFDNVSTNYQGSLIGVGIDGLTIRFKGTNDFIGNEYLVSAFTSFKISGDGYASSVVNFTRGCAVFGQTAIYTVSNDNPINVDIENVTLNLTDNLQRLGVIANVGAGYNAATLNIKASRLHLVEQENCPESVINGFTSVTFTACSPVKPDIAYVPSKRALCNGDGSVVTDFELMASFVSVNSIYLTAANSAEGDVTAGLSYDASSKTVTLNNINRSSGLLIATNIDGLRIRLVGNNSIKHRATSFSSFIRADANTKVIIDGGNSGTLTIEHGSQGSYPMFDMYPGSTVEIRDVPSIDITCGHVVMHGNINNKGTARLFINHSSGTFTTTSSRFSNVIDGIAELQLASAEIVTGNSASRKPYSSGRRDMVFRATDGNKYDVNSDGNVDVGDVNAVLKAILAGDNASKYDVNGDSAVDVGDVNAILQAILAQ